MIDKDFVKRKISLIQEDLVHLPEMTHFTLDEIAQDFMKQATLERLLERIINRAIDINRHMISEMKSEKIPSPKDFRDTFLILSELEIFSLDFAQEISKSIGTRNVLAQEYDKINRALIYNSIGDCLKDYNNYCGLILKFIEK